MPLPDIVDLHERTLSAPPSRVGDLLDRVAEPGNPLWPSPPWWPMRLDRPLGVGAEGGHGPVHYLVVVHDPGRHVRFDVDAVAFLPVSGHHELEVAPGPRGGSVLRHRLVVGGAVRGYALWFTVVRPLHRRMIRALLDNAERALDQASKGTGRA